MKAIVIREYGNADVLKYEEMPTPQIGPNEVLIRVVANAINPADWKTRNGMFKDMRALKFPFIMGVDTSGYIEEVGSLVTRFKKGDAVITRADGGHAEFVAAKSDLVAPAPKNIPLNHAAGLPVTSTTAWRSLFDTGHLQKGETILIHGGAGGVGSFAVQMAHLAGARVISTASGDSLDIVKKLGADEVIDYKKSDFSTLVKNVDMVLDTIGGDTQKKSWGTLKEGGRLVSLPGPPDENMAKQYKVKGIFRSQEGNGALLEDISKLVDAKKLQVVIDKEFAWEEIKKAHELSEKGHAQGKIILNVWRS